MGWPTHAFLTAGLDLSFLRLQIPDLVLTDVSGLCYYRDRMKEIRVL